MLKVSSDVKPNEIMKNWVDPEAKAEAERYDNPIPSRILIQKRLNSYRRRNPMPTWLSILKSGPKVLTRLITA